MARYSLHFLNREKRLVGLTVLECETDQEASKKSAALADGSIMELWRDNIRIRRFDPFAAKAATASAPIVLDQPVEAVLESALTQHRAGQLADAAKQYAKILRTNGRNAQAMTLLGTLRAQQGDLDEALSLLNRSLEIDARQPFALNSLGNALNTLGRHDEALAAFDKAIALKPGQASTYSNGGNALRGLKRRREALAAYRRAITIDPAYAEAHSNRADVLVELKRYDDAIASYDTAIGLRPDSVRDWLGKAAAFQDSGRLQQAVESYDRALALKSDVPDVWNNRGNALSQLGHYKEALKSYSAAIHLKRDYSAAHYNRGNALRALRRSAEAAESYYRSIAAFAEYAPAHHNLGNALKDIGRHEEALASYNAAIELDPRNADTYFKRSVVLRDLKRFDEALASIEKAIELDPELPYALGERMAVKSRMCDWKDLPALSAAIADGIGRGARAASPFTVIALEGTPALQRQCAEIFAREKYPSQPPPETPAAAPAGASESGRIRIAYLSSDFYAHAVSYLMAGVLEQHDRSRFEIFAISFGKSDGSDLRARVEKACEHFVDVRDMSDREVAALLRAQKIDIAVDLKGYTKDARTGILASRPAPIQVNYLGYPGTMGVDYIDYLIADEVVVPEDDKPSYSEKIVYMPDTYQCNDSKRPIADVPPSRAEAGLPETGFVFCSFNNNYKITPQMFGIWMRLLKETEGSVLWLLQSNTAAARNLRKEAEARGVDPKRLIFAPFVSPSAHLARIRLADLFLDSLPYCGHTTGSDALWAGVPVLTCTGNTFAGRVATSLLNAIGLPEMVTRSLDEYQTRALALARNPSALAALKAKLARNRMTQPLFDTVLFTRHLEAAYAKMVERQRAGQPPAAFAVPRTTDFETSDRS